MMTMKGYSTFPQTSPSDCLMSYTGHSLRGSYPSADVQSVYSAAPTNWTTGHSFGESYPSADVQSVSSAAPANWTTGNSFGETYPSADVQSVYPAAPVDWAKLKMSRVLVTTTNIGRSLAGSTVKM